MIDRLFVFQWKLGILRWNCQAVFHGLSGLADTIRFLIWAKIGPSLRRRVFLPVTLVLNTSTFFKRADASEATKLFTKADAACREDPRIRWPQVDYVATQFHLPLPVQDRCRVDLWFSERYGESVGIRR